MNRGPVALWRMGYTWDVSNSRGAAVQPKDGQGRAHLKREHLLILQGLGIAGKDFQP